MASNLIAEEESLLLGRGDDLSGSGSKGGQQHQQHQQQQKPKGGSLLVGGAPHKVDPVAERRKAKVRERGGESKGEEGGGRVWLGFSPISWHKIKEQSAGRD
jgi:hypothetical protein